MLHGRTKEKAALDALLERARSGQGGCLVMHGEPGIGKTALLEYAAERAGGMQVLRTAGVVPEADLGYAALHRLLLPVLDRIGQLPDPQADALDAVFGHTAGPSPDRFLVALAALSLISEAAGVRPMLCLVDDAHWCDAASLDVLAFVARRLDAEPVALVVAMRADEGRLFDMSGLVDVPLVGLDRAAALSLLTDHGGSGMSVVEQEELLRVTGGNPLAIRELASSPLRRAPGEPVPLTAGLQRTFLERVRGRDPAARRMLLLVAADGTGWLDTIRRAAETLDGTASVETLDDLDDLIIQDGPRVAFRHPLIRSAVFHGASPAERRRAHRALALALAREPTPADGSDAGLDRRAWHLAQAAVGPDEQVAEMLERSAQGALRRAGPAAAASALGRAAELSASEPDRARRLMTAADAWWQAGDTARAVELLERAEHADALPERAKLDASMLRALIELRSGTPHDAVELLRPLIPDALHGDRHLAVRLLMLFGEGCFHANAADAYAEIAAALDGLPVPGDDADAALIRLIRGAHRVRAGIDSGLDPGDLATVEQVTDPVKLCWASGLALGLGDPELARRLRRAGVQRARALGAAGALAWALEPIVFDEVARSRFAVAEAYAEEGHRLAVDTRQPNMACRHRSWLALLAALRGRERDARRHAEAVLTEAAERRLAAAAVTARRALGLLELAAGRPGEALRHLDDLRHGGSVHPAIALANTADMVEAAVRVQQLERAGLLRDFVAWSDASGAPGLRALAARCRALLASGDAAESEFLKALRLHARADQPMEQARTELLFGEHLRRARRRSDARPHLRAALETFRRLGVPVWADRAHQELRATGETVRPRTPSAVDTLTAQELRIAAAVGEGATNREVAAQLFLSTRTVDYHLRKVFKKLGISSRAELIRRPIVEDIAASQESLPSSDSSESAQQPPPPAPPAEPPEG